MLSREWIDFYLYSGESHSSYTLTLQVRVLLTDVENGKLVLGTWQAVFFCEFDGHRRRNVLLKLISDKPYRNMKIILTSYLLLSPFWPCHAPVCNLIQGYHTRGLSLRPAEQSGIHLRPIRRQ